MKRVCIFCSSSDQIDSKYFEATETLIRNLVEEGYHILTGGGRGGLMGKIADIVHQEGGLITGIMPHFMKEVEWTHPEMKDYIFTETMAERKQKLIENVDAVITLAGGTGTWEELFETITLKRLGLFTKPIVILNTDGYYDSLQDMINRSVAEKFLGESQLKYWSFVHRPEDVIPMILSMNDTNKDAIHYAKM